MTVRSIKIRLSACFGLLTLGAGMQLPFLPLWLTDKGLSPQQVAQILAGMLVARAVAQPLITGLADRFQNRRIVVRVCAITALLAMILLSQQSSPGWIAGVACLVAFLFAPVFPLVESFSVDTSAAHGLDYGRLRLWASLSFLAGSLTAGLLLTILPASAAIYLMVGGYVCSVGSAFLMPRESPPHAHDTAIQLDMSLWRFLLWSRFSAMILAVSVAMSSHAMLNSFGTVYWSGLGFDTFTISLFWSCAVMSEVGLFAFSKRVVAKLGMEWLIVLGMAGGIVRWVGMSLVSSAWAFALVSVLHVMSFAMMHLGTMHFIRAHVPVHLRNTVQGLYSSLSGGVFMAIATSLSGGLFAKHGGEAFLLMVGVSCFGFVIAWLVRST
jgi:MFS transporter, PPP family, 3-phenylpropionic acid transporter